MKHGNKTYKQISDEYKVLITVIFNKVKGRKTRITCRKNGRQPALTIYTENNIEKCLIVRARMGEPCNNIE